jgi:quercetin dioxygenase-like cupin family protein
MSSGTCTAGAAPGRAGKAIEEWPPAKVQSYSIPLRADRTLKLQNGETAGSVMMFEEVAPVGTATDVHTHHQSDEVAYVLSSEITFKIGDEVTVGGPGTCAFLPRDVPHARSAARPCASSALHCLVSHSSLWPSAPMRRRRGRRCTNG